MSLTDLGTPTNTKNNKRGTSAERSQRLLKEASVEAVVLDLNPNANKRKKKPQKLAPLSDL